MLEVARSFGVMLQQGWKPQRVSYSILYTSYSILYTLFIITTFSSHLISLLLSHSYEYRYHSNPLPLRTLSLRVGMEKNTDY